MSIDVSSLPGGLVQNTGETTRPSTQGTTSSSSNSGDSPSVGSDRISLTDSVSLLRELESQVASLPVVDNKRVEDTQRALATGSFQIDPPRVADKMLAVEKSFG